MTGVRLMRRQGNLCESSDTGTVASKGAIMQRVRRVQWLRPTAGISLLAVVSLTCAPICGSSLDVDSVSCCERHGCIPAGPNAASMESTSHAMMAMAPVSFYRIGFDTESCCQEGELTYPTAQVRGSAADGSPLQVLARLVVPLIPLLTQSSREKRETPFAGSPPTHLYTLNATFRI